MNNKAVAIITARGGSKRIPRKNIKAFCGKPMIAWSIETAISSEIFDNVIVSTDSEEIAAISLHYGAVVPFIRPLELADDFTPTAPVLMHAIKWIINSGKNYKYFCCIYPTAPFMVVNDLVKSYEFLKDKSAPGVVSVTTFPYPVLRSFLLDSSGSVNFAWPEYESTRSQDLPEYYHDAGQFYWHDTELFLKHGKLIPKGMLPFILPRIRVQDIDTFEDWNTAEKIAKALKLY